MKYCVLLLLSLVACQPSHRIANDEQTAESTASDQTQPLVSDAILQTDEKVYFKASGTEPFWNLEISEELLRFTSPLEGFETFVTPYSEAMQNTDSLKMYRAETESGILKVEMVPSQCIQVMKDTPSPYQVSVEIKRGTDVHFTRFEGCGAYIPDYRLHDIWALDSLNGVLINKENFQKGQPYMELHVRDAVFYGFAGCNSMQGQLFSEHNLLRFTHVVATKMACGESEFETEFLAALQTVTSYRIGNNRLSLSEADSVLLVFRKVD